MKSSLVALVLMGLFLMLLYAVLRRATRTWWIWGSVVSIAFLVVVMVLGPVFIAPIFNKYTLLEDERVLEPILKMARASGIDADKVYQMNASMAATMILA